MTIANRFARQTASTPVVAKRRFEGVQAAAQRDPMPPAGDFRFRVVGIEESHANPNNAGSFKITVECVESSDGTQPGEVFKVINMITAVGLQQMKSFAMAVAGYDDEAAYDKFDAKGDFIEALLNADNQFARDETGKLVGNPGIGVVVDCRVSLGKPDGRGDHYRNYQWAPVPEDEQA